MHAYRVFIGSVIWALPGVRETRTYAVMEEVKNATALSLCPQGRCAGRGHLEKAEERSMKTLGVPGGMSWESTTIYYRLLNQGVAARLGGLHSEALLPHGVDFPPMAKRQAAAALPPMAMTSNRLTYDLHMPALGDGNAASAAGRGPRACSN
jgi:hypothetical protein